MQTINAIKRQLWILLMLSVLLFAFTSSAALAQDDDPTTTVPPRSSRLVTSTPTPTTGPFGPTPTPTATLPAPPSGAGRVQVQELVVRTGPDSEFPALEELKYGDVVRPVAIDVGGVWVAVERDDGSLGWISSNLVQWDATVDFDSLPNVQRTPIPDGFFLTPEEDRVFPTTTPEDEETPTSEPQDAADTPEPATEEIPQEEAETPGETEAAAVPAQPTEISTPAPSDGSPTLPDASNLPSAINSTTLTIIGALIGSLALLGLILLYFQRRGEAKRELQRYEAGFPLEICSVCQVGKLTLEEKVKGAFGIPQVTRSVRCSNCRSLLREVEPGFWRYNIDPYVNPNLAYKYNTQQFSDAGLLELVEEAYQYQPVVEEEPEEQVVPIEATDIVDLVPEMEPIIFEIEKAQAEDLRKLQGHTEEPEEEDVSAEVKSEEAEAGDETET